MPRYVDKALQKFQHPQPKQPQHDLHDWTVSAYGSKSQYDQDVLDQLHLDPYGKQWVKSITGTLLYYYL